MRSAIDTIYCVKDREIDTIYSVICFMTVFHFPKLGKRMGKLYGVNFVRCLVFKPVYPAKAGFFVWLFASSKVRSWGNYCQ